MRRSETCASAVHVSLKRSALVAGPQRLIVWRQAAQQEGPMPESAEAEDEEARSTLHKIGGPSEQRLAVC